MEKTLAELVKMSNNISSKLEDKSGATESTGR